MLVAERFQSFTPQHFLLIGLFLAGCPLVIRLGRRQRGTRAETTGRQVFAIVIVLVAVPQQIIQLLPNDWDLGVSLPLQLCDLAWVAAVIALWYRSWWANALTYYWGIVLTSQAIITPSLGQSFPDPRYFAFWAHHFLVVWAALYLTWGLGVRPTWRGYRFTVAATAVWALVVYVFNVVADTNYGYINEKPSSGSVLNFFGPWPLYVGVEVVILIVVWALMTWPWVRTGP